ncbi:hypothetical protein PG987_002566 [Apiospora arundinis]
MATWWADIVIALLPGFAAVLGTVVALVARLVTAPGAVALVASVGCKDIIFVLGRTRQPAIVIVGISAADAWGRLVGEVTPGRFLVTKIAVGPVGLRGTAATAVVADVAPALATTTVVRGVAPSVDIAVGGVDGVARILVAPGALVGITVVVITTPAPLRTLHG